MRSTSPQTGFHEEQQAGFDPGNPPAPPPFRWLEKAELEAVGRQAGAWLDLNRHLVDTLPAGAYLLIEVETGGHVSEASYDAARAEFDRRYGASTMSFVHRVGVPTTVGGGWWALHSGA